MCSRRTVRTAAVATLFSAGALSALAADRLEPLGEMPMSAENDAHAPLARPKYTNRLVNATSPYLLQHAHNPVNWYPWATEALDKARNEDRPVFLSIGYSACHWCHVMEKESFEDPGIAAILNQHFVAIKVDREERPDIDRVYMKAVQLMTGSGGWPLSVFLTPDLRPFFGGTYFPPEGRLGRIGFRDLLLRLVDAWQQQRADLMKNAAAVTSAVQAPLGLAEAQAVDLSSDMLDNAVKSLSASFDTDWGGFSDAPKFPPAGALMLLMRRHGRSGDEALPDMLQRTFERMAWGGMYDQLGGGFHRYSVDEKWLVPHFEKMLYDNALLSVVYLEAYQLTGRPLYRRVATETLDYVLRDMTDAQGGFHSSQDADSEGVEGKYYVWTEKDIVGLLGAENADLFARYYGISSRGNFEGANILHVPVDPEEFARRNHLTQAELAERLAVLRSALLRARTGRIPPAKDDKILAAWNGLMVSAFAQGYQVLGEERFLIAAKRAADFLLRSMLEDGALLRAYRQGRASARGVLDDYAFVSNALIDLYESCFDIRWLEAAEELARSMIEQFWDSAGHGFFFTAHDHEKLLSRDKPYFDESRPSGNAVATLVLLRLAAFTGNADYRTKAEESLRTAAPLMQRAGGGMMHMLRALDYMLTPPREIAIVGRREANDTRQLLAAARSRFLPTKVVALLDASRDDAARTVERVPLLSGKAMLAGAATAYVCRNFACQSPVTTPDALGRLLDEAER